MGLLILDTDHLSLIQRSDGSEGLRLIARLEQASGDQVVTTIISYEEQTRGWLAFLAKARSIAQQVQAYRRLQEHVEMYVRIPLLAFDDPAASIFQSLQRQRLRIGVMDQKIASIALSTGATLLTRNLSDFAKVPGLEVEDWTK